MSPIVSVHMCHVCSRTNLTQQSSAYIHVCVIDMCVVSLLLLVYFPDYETNEINLDQCTCELCTRTPCSVYNFCTQFARNLRRDNKNICESCGPKLQRLFSCDHVMLRYCLCVYIWLMWPDFTRSHLCWQLCSFCRMSRHTLGNVVKVYSVKLR